jgi:hypothetical protein
MGDNVGWIFEVYQNPVVFTITDLRSECLSIPRLSALRETGRQTSQGPQTRKPAIGKHICMRVNTAHHDLQSGVPTHRISSME